MKILVQINIHNLNISIITKKKIKICNNRRLKILNSTLYFMKN